MKLVLASQSPRRRELLEWIQKDFIVQASSAEEVIPPGATPYEAVELLARVKAQAVAKDYPDCVVIGADTVVALDGQIMALSGREHEVYTGVALVVNGQTESFYERTAVRFLPLTEEEINWYADLDEPYDKAGAYGIQGYGSLLVEGICGDYFNVMGLPVAALNRRLKALGRAEA